MLRTFTIDPNALTIIKSRMASSNPALAKLLRDANDSLKVGPFSVMHKISVPPSGDTHDYQSRGRYWWRNPSTSDGLPYIERDGEVNPEIWQISDHKDFDTLMDNVLTLGLAFYFTECNAFAEHATKLLRVWFLDEATRMNPNLRFAQGIPGINDGRCTGLIETRELAQVIDAIGLIADSSAWTDADQWGMERWFTRYLDWLLGDDMARLEGEQKNNHGTFYDSQVIAIALFLNATELARKFLGRLTTVRIPTQIAIDGSQPYEITRTLSWHYHIFNLQALCRVALLGERVGMDAWNFKTQGGTGIRTAFEFLIPFATDMEWPYPQIAPRQYDAFFALLWQAANKWNASHYRDIAHALSNVETNTHRVHLYVE